MTWQFPQNPLPQTIIPPTTTASTSNSNISRSDSGFASQHTAFQRHKEWQDSFSSLYDAFRNGTCDAFYLISPHTLPGTNTQKTKPFAILFRAASIAGHPRMHAIMSRSTAGLRAKLQQSGIGFEAPLLHGADDFAYNPSNGGAGAPRDGTAEPLSSISEGTRSALLFRGALRVHGLFDFLLNYAASSLTAPGCDVPILMAPVQFTNANVKKFHVEASVGMHAGSAVHCLEIKGGGSGYGGGTGGGNMVATNGPGAHGAIVPMWVVDRVLNTLSMAQQGTTTCYAEVTHDTVAFNHYESTPTNAITTTAPIDNDAGIFDNDKNRNDENSLDHGTLAADGRRVAEEAAQKNISSEREPLSRQNNRAATNKQQRRRSKSAEGTEGLLARESGNTGPAAPDADGGASTAHRGYLSKEESRRWSMNGCMCMQYTALREVSCEWMASTDARAYKVKRWMPRVDAVSMHQ